MNKRSVFKDFSILILITVLGLGLTLALPWLIDSQILAAQPPGNPPQAIVYYVSEDGDNSAPTEGFDTGFKYLWDAIAFVGLSGGGEIWVAAGVYYPDEGGTPTNNDPTSTFYLADTIQLYGGFDTNDTKFSDRDWEKNLTVLSGDIGNNDKKDLNGVVIDVGYIKGPCCYSCRGEQQRRAGRFHNHSRPGKWREFSGG